MSGQHIPYEIINNIFSHFPSDQTKNFYPYLFINKDWCQAAFSYIWARPFHGLSHGNKGLISIYLSCLDKSRLTSLESQGLDLSSISRPFVNYSSFLKQLNYSEFILSAIQWCNVRQKGDSDHNNTSAVIRSILYLFCENSIYLNSLVIQTNEKNIYDEEYFLILIEEEFKDMMKPIRRVAVHTHFKMEKFFHGLSRHSRNVEKMNIGLHGYNSLSYGTHPTFNNSISASSWISSQTRLRSLTVFISCWDTSPIIESLPSQKTLKHIKFDYVNFKNCKSLEKLMDCENLEVLEFLHCRELRGEMVEDLIRCDDEEERKDKGVIRKLKKLKTLIIGNTCHKLTSKKQTS